MDPAPETEAGGDPAASGPGAPPGAGSRRLPLLIGAVTGAGLLAMLASTLQHHPVPAPAIWRLGVALVIGALADLTLINIRFGHNRHSFTWAEAFILLGIILVPAPWLVLAAPVGVLVMHLSLRRPLQKAAFNAFGIGAGAFLAAEVYGLVHGAGRPTLASSRDLAGLVLASLVFCLWNQATVAWAVALSQGLRFAQVIVRGIALVALVWVGNTLAGAGLVALYTYDQRSLIMLPVLLGFVYLVYRAYLKASQEAEIWQMLQSVSDVLTHIDQDELALAVTKAAASLFEAEFSELSILGEGGVAQICRRTPSAVERFEMAADAMAPGFWPRAHSEREQFRAVAGKAAAGQQEEMDALGLSACMVSPLVVSGQCIGMLRLGFRGPVRISQREEQILGTFANQVATSAHNAQLFERTAELSEHNRAIAESLGEGVIAIDVDGLITFANPAAASIIGNAWADLRGRPVHDVLHGVEGTVHPLDTACPLLEVLTTGITVRREDQYLIHRGAGTVPAAFTASPLFRGERIGGERVMGAVITVRDMTERRALEAQLTYQAFHDSTTDVANRALFLDRLAQAMANPSGRGSAAVLFMDLDRFKVVNDSLGHRAGDALLRQVAQRVSTCLRPSDTLARWGGDEFTVLLEVADEREAASVAQRILAVMNRPFPAVGRDVVLTASIGVAVGSPGCSDPQSVIHDADVAMYRAKNQGRDTYAVFSPDMGDQPLERLEMETALRRALDVGEFQVHYQPIVSIDSGQLTGVEALVRWSSTSGLLSPASFIGLAEETGLILPLGRLVLEEACRRVREMHEAHPEVEPIGLSVNLSARQFQDGHLGQDVADILELTGLEARHLCLEITETVIMQDVPSTMSTLNELKALGVRLAIDDFGTGYSSLSYLKRFPVDVVKIDKSFVDDLGEHAVDTEIVAAVIRLARSLGMKTVAEGVESEAQLDKLRELGCPLVQGYYYSPAQPAERIEAILERQLGSRVTRLV